MHVGILKAAQYQIHHLFTWSDIIPPNIEKYIFFPFRQQLRPSSVSMMRRIWRDDLGPICAICMIIGRNRCNCAFTPHGLRVLWKPVKLRLLSQDGRPSSVCMMEVSRWHKNGRIHVLVLKLGQYKIFRLSTWSDIIPQNIEKSTFFGFILQPRPSSVCMMKCIRCDNLTRTSAMHMVIGWNRSKAVYFEHGHCDLWKPVILRLSIQVGRPSSVCMIGVIWWHICNSMHVCILKPGRYQSHHIPTWSDIIPQNIKNPLFTFSFVFPLSFC